MCAIGLIVAGTRIEAQLPTRLPDSEFWQLIEHVSEPGGRFVSDNFVSNEIRLQHVIPRLVKIVPPGGVYLGVGPEQNFTYITNLKPAMAFIIDIRRQNMIHHLLYKAIMERSPTRADFLSLLLSRPALSGVDTESTIQALFRAVRAAPTSDSLFRANLATVWNTLTVTHGFGLSTEDQRSLEYVYTAFHLAGPDLTYNFRPDRGSPGGYSTLETIQNADNGAGVNLGYLANEANYRWLREMQLNNLVVPVVGNFAGPTALAAVGEYLRGRRANVNVIYTSNVEEYLFQQGAAPRYYATVAALPLDTNAMFIRSAVAGPLIQSGPAGGPVTVLEQILCPVRQFLQSVDSGLIRTYRDVVGAAC